MRLTSSVVYDLLADAWRKVDELPNDTMNISAVAFYDVYDALISLPYQTRVMISRYMEQSNVFSKETWKQALDDLMESACGS